MLKQLWPLVLGSVALGLDAYVIAGLLPQIAEDLGASGSVIGLGVTCLLYTSPSPRDLSTSRMPSSA